MESLSARTLEESRRGSARIAAEISGGIPIWKMWKEGQFTSVSVNVVARHSLLMGIGIVNTAVTVAISMADSEVAKMQVSKNVSVVTPTPARIMTKEAMQRDFDYEVAQKITKNLLDEGLISIDEYDRISALNAQKFSPFYADLMDI